MQDIANAIREKNGLATLYKIGEMGQAIREIKTGASGLNVIRSATKPASAAENTVWLETDMQNGALTVSSVEPANPVEGDVWIAPNNARPFELPVFEGVNISMGVARLRAAGAWSFIDFAGYVNGAWKDSHTPLFKDGAWGGVLLNGTVSVRNWDGGGSGIPATFTISDGILSARGNSYKVTGGSGFTLKGTADSLELSAYSWQRITLQLVKAVDAYFGLLWSVENAGGTEKLEGTHILLSEATQYTTFSRAIDYSDTGLPAVLIRNPNTSVITQMGVNVSDWYLV